MPKYDTRLSGAGYELKQVFPGIWRWRVFPVYGEGTGVAWGRRGAMRAARTYLRDRKSPPSPCDKAVGGLPAVLERGAGELDRRAPDSVSPSASASDR